MWPTMQNGFVPVLLVIVVPPEPGYLIYAVPPVASPQTVTRHVWPACSGSVGV